MANLEIKEVILEHIARNKAWYKTGGREKWNIEGDIVHVKYRSGPKVGGNRYSYNVSPSSLDADFEVWICGDISIYYLIPTKTLADMYNDPNAYVDSYHPNLRVIDINTETHKAQYARGRPYKDFSSYFLARLDKELEIIVESDLEAVQEEEEYFEGRKIERFSSYYERKLKLRTKAVLTHGTKCKACGFDYENFYGERGKDFIEVHHLFPISVLENETRIDPESDMTVVCANCHRMIHRKRDRVLSIEELIEIIQTEKTE